MAFGLCGETKRRSGGEKVASEADRILELERNYGTLAGEVGVIKAELIPLKEGVKNFRDFRDRGLAFFERAEASLDSEDERRNEMRDQSRRAEHRKDRWLKVVSILAPFVLAALTFLCYQAFVFTEDMIQIDEIYHKDLKAGHSFFDDMMRGAHLPSANANISASVVTHRSQE